MLQGYDDPVNGWLEGFAILAAVVVVALVTSINNYSKELQFQKLNAKQLEFDVNVVRNTELVAVSVTDLVVGDLLYLPSGMTIPVDGRLVSGEITVNEAALTGESDDIVKRVRTNLKSGSNITYGSGYMEVSNVGVNTYLGKIRMSLQTSNDATPLQQKLEHLAALIGYVGMAFAVATFIMLLWREFAYPSKGLTFDFFVHAFTVCVTIVVVAVPEGLPLAVTLSLAFSVGKMLKDYNLVRNLSSCETMGNATYICTDKTGTLTTNQMTVVAGCRTGVMYKHINPHSVSPTTIECISATNPITLSCKNGIMVPTGGNSTDIALANFIGHAATPLKILHSWPFSSVTKCSIAAVQYGREYVRIYVKGAPDWLLPKCSTYEGRTISNLTPTVTKKIRSNIESMASQSLRIIAFAYKDVQISSLGRNWKSTLPDTSSMTFCSLLAIKDPLREGVPEAVRTCQNAGVTVVMITGDCLETAVAIATEAGILTEDGIVVEGNNLAYLSYDEKLRVRVIARALPQHKKDHVQFLQSNGEVVGVTGDGTNDAPALKAADVGLSMGISGTDIAKEASDIVITNDNFASIVTAIKWGRAVFDNIRKFLQFQLTVNLVALMITFISAMLGNELPLNAVMMLWVNMIMDTLGALALGTEPPSDKLLDRKPYSRTTSLISPIMWRNIFVQSAFQIGLLYYLLQQEYSSTMIFNTFVFCQIFNEFNARSIDNTMNVFRGIFDSPIFVSIIAITVAAQYCIVEYGGEFVKTTSLSSSQWYDCILMASATLPIGGLMRITLFNFGTKREQIYEPSYIVWFILVSAIPFAIMQRFCV
jgi:calcium-translocating P-type ATPase